MLRLALRLLGMILLLLFTLVTSATAQQGDPKTRRAKALFDEGVAMSDEGKWAEALDRFRQSNELVASMTVRYNIAVAYRALGRYVQARGTLRAIVEEAKDARTQLKPALRADINRLLEQVNANIVELRVRLRPKGAKLQLDGTTAELDEDGHLELDPGQHVFTVSAKGYETTTVRRDLSSADKEISLNAKKVKDSAPVPPTDKSTPIYESFWFWAVAGAVVAGATTAIIFTSHDDTRAIASSPPPATVDRVIPAWLRF